MGAVLQIVAGFVLLALGGEGVVRGAVGLARRLGLSELLIGVVLVGFGASMPEFITGINAALHGAPGLAVGNVVGANISNILLIIGAAAVVAPLAMDQRALTYEGGALMALSLAVAAWSIFEPAINWMGGVLMLALLGAFLVTTYRNEKRNPKSPTAVRRQDEAAAVQTLSLPVSLALTIGAIVALVAGAEFLVQGGVVVAHDAGVSQTVIGQTVIAVGTSLPELAACVAAALRGRSDIAFGTIVGSCIYNVLGVLGAVALITPVRLVTDFNPVDWIAFLGAPILLVGHGATGQRINRVEGGFMLALYGLYLWYVFSHVAPDAVSR